MNGFSSDFFFKAKRVFNSSSYIVCVVFICVYFQQVLCPFSARGKMNFQNVSPLHTVDKRNCAIKKKLFLVKKDFKKLFLT